MDPSVTLPPLNAAEILRSYHLRPRKSLGQNFLCDSSILERITALAEIQPESDVLEIGAGLGSLTRYLAQAARSVVAVELDSQLIPPLEAVLKPWLNVKIVNGDILKLDPAELMPEENYLVIANIPYYITSAVLRHLLESRRKPDRLDLTIQREVAERICAAPGDMSLLALSVQVYGKPRILLRVPAGAFYPAPQVDSSLLHVDLYSQPLISTPELPHYFRLIKAGFSQKRKTLRNSLAGGLSISTEQAGRLLAAASIDPARRAETLSIEEWQQLTRVFRTASPD